MSQLRAGAVRCGVTCNKRCCHSSSPEILLQSVFPLGTHEIFGLECAIHGEKGMGLSAGTRLGPYEVVSPVGAGGMGEVYRARDTRLDRIVAIKVLNSALSSTPDLKARFEREAK